MDGFKILRGHPKALNDPSLTGKDSLLCELLCPQHLKIRMQILKLCIEEQGKADFLYSLRMRMTSDP